MVFVAAVVHPRPEALDKGHVDFKLERKPPNSSLVGVRDVCVHRISETMLKL